MRKREKERERERERERESERERERERERKKERERERGREKERKKEEVKKCQQYSFFPGYLGNKTAPWRKDGVSEKRRLFTASPQEQGRIRGTRCA